MVARPPAHGRWLLAVPVVMLLACQTDRVVDSPPAEGEAARGDVPTVTIRYPIGYPISGGTCYLAGLGCTYVDVIWSGDDGSGTDDRIAGYQMKMLDGYNPCTRPFNDILDDLLSPYSCERNLLIPDSLIVEEDVPVGDSTFHACDWYPKPTSLVTDTSLTFRGIASYTVIAIRAVDENGNVTPREAFSPAVGGETGNVLSFQQGLPTNPLVVVHEHTLDVGAAGVQRDVNVPVGYALVFDWQAFRPACGPVPAFEFAYAIDIPDPTCDTCTEPDGIGGWTPWQSDLTELPFPLEITEEDAGTTRTLHVKARDPGYEPAEFLPAGFDIHVYAGGFQRPALWVDDFVSGSIDDCAHDALVRPWLDDAVRPYIRAQEGIASWPAHEPGDGACSESGDLRVPSRDELLRFRMLFWNVSQAGAGSALGAVTRSPHYYGSDSEVLREYVRAGGGVVVWGRNTIGALLGDDYPIDAAYVPELPGVDGATFGPGTFLWDVAHFRTRFDRVGRGTSRRLAPSCSGVIGLEATPTAIAEGYAIGVLDPSGYSTDPSNTTVTPRTAIWFGGWEGRQNPFGAYADVAQGPPALHVEGLDTLYTAVSNSWSYVEDGPLAIRDACGTSFPSSFEGKPIVMRVRATQGRFVWIGAELTDFAEHHGDDVRLLLGKLAAWVLEGD